MRREWLIAVSVFAIVSGASSPALGKVTVTATPSSIGVDETVTISVKTRPQARRCSIRLVGTVGVELATKYLRRGKATVRLDGDAIDAGTYQAVARCGRAGRGTSSAFEIRGAPSPVVPVPDPSPSGSGACRIAAAGANSFSSRGVATAGFEVRNDSSSDAVDVQVAASFVTSSGSETSQARSLHRIPAGQSGYVGFDNVPIGAPVVRVQAGVSCTSEPPGAITALVQGVATAKVTPAATVSVKGQVDNGYPFWLAVSAPVYYVTFDKQGGITGGGRSLLTSPLAPGGSVAWAADNRALSPGEPPVSVRFTVDPLLRG